MIFVTLGTQDKSFVRLLKIIQKQIDLGNINKKVIVQAGHTKYNSKQMETFDLIDMHSFNDFLQKSDFIITHGGVGSIISALKYNKKVIAVARLKKYREHTNDHQEQIIDIMYKAGHILKYDEDNDFSKILKEVELFEPKKYVSNTKNVIEYISNFIDSN